MIDTLCMSAYDYYLDTVLFAADHTVAVWHLCANNPRSECEPTTIPQLSGTRTYFVSMLRLGHCTKTKQLFTQFMQYLILHLSVKDDSAGSVINVLVCISAFKIIDLAL